MLSVYLRKAQRSGIRVKNALAFPEEFSANPTELATALANALENAIKACEKLPDEQRLIEVKVISKPQFMIMIRNPFAGEVTINEEGLPESGQENHGFGTRSIAAFCHKNGGDFDFEVTPKS